MLDENEIKMLNVIKENVGESTPVLVLSAKVMGMKNTEILFTIAALEQKEMVEIRNKSEYFITDIGEISLKLTEHVNELNTGNIAVIETDLPCVQIVWEWADATSNESYESRALISVQYIRIELEERYSKEELTDHLYIDKTLMICKVLEEHGFDYAMLMSPHIEG